MCKTSSCKALPPAKTIAERNHRRAIKRAEQAAARPGVREFGRLVAEARQLAFEIDRWLEENPTCELTDTNLALMVALRDDDDDSEMTTEYHRTLSCMSWALTAGADFLTGPMLIHLFPDCFKRPELKSDSRSLALEV